MSKIRNLVVYPKTPAELYAIKADYEAIGREVDIQKDEIGDKLIILALPRKYKKKDEMESKLKAKREAYEDKDF